MNNIKITVRHIKVTAEIKRHLQNKIDSLKHYFDSIKYIEIILDLNKDQFVVETLISVVHGKKLFSKISDYNYIAAINNAVDKMEKQLAKIKDKKKQPHHKIQLPAQEDTGLR
jgi:ribosomal subunit interface protein